MEKREFYAAVAAILDVDDPYVELLPYRRRWGQRKPGNGRYEGVGLIRWFSASHIQVTMEGYSTSTFKDSSSALEFVKEHMPQSSSG